ncbi:MAG: hypothetical protein GXZ15_01700 [Campylobacter sp.]|nr:hypothetical protein [Campylobacter sp.]
MNKNLEQLIELSKFDEEIDSFLPKLDAINEKLNLKNEEIASVERQIEATQADIEDISKQIATTNTHIAQFTTKIKDSGKKSSAIKTEREMKALNLEENLAKEQLTAANEDISRLEKLVDTKNEIKIELDSKKSTLETELSELEKTSGEERDVIENERSSLYVNKEKLLTDMDAKIIVFYEKIRRWAGNTTVAKVKKQACYGCFMKINDKTYSAVLKDDDIVTCPHCGRILYKESE